MGKLQDLVSGKSSTDAEPICSPTDTNDLAAEFAADWSAEPAVENGSIDWPEAGAEAAREVEDELLGQSDAVKDALLSVALEREPVASSIPTIASSAGLVHIEFTKWGGPVTDRAVTDEVLKRKNATEGAAVVKKRPIPNSPELKRIESLSNTLRNRGKKYCLPWIGNGWYLLPTANYADFMRAMAQANTEWDQAVDAFIKVYATQVHDAVNNLGGMYDSSLYPSEGVLRAAFRMEVHEGEVQTTGKAAYYDNLTEQQIADSQYRVEQQNERYVSAINPYIWDKMRKPLEDLLDVLSEDRYLLERQPQYQQTKVTNVIDAATEGSALNVTNDSQIVQMTARIRGAFVGITVDALKDSMHLRNDIRNTINTILGGFPS
tara:strand:- start:4007 stop:5137 length:1131 start_codon:yes stop_codon:yes gene_type:complete